MRNWNTKVASVVMIVTMLWAVPAMAWSAADQTVGVSPAQESYIVGWYFEKQGSYYQAYEHYQEALDLLKADPRNELVKTVKDRMFRLAVIMVDYPLTEEQARAEVVKAFPDKERWEIERWFANDIKDCIEIDGERYYTSTVVDNLKFRNTELMHADPASAVKGQKFWDLFSVFFPGEQPLQGESPNINPLKYKMVQTVKVPRNVFPASGMLHLWLPYPIETDCQTDVELISISPAGWVIGQPDPQADLGQVYFEIPLEKLKSDLDISIECTFTHYQQQSIVDPAKVGAYDKNSDLYRQYTRSFANTTFNQSMRQTAERIVGGEQNPYLAARKIYDYVVKDIKYSLMPHASMQVMGLSESVYVHERGYGDCGSQSMYFTALCRSIGIPARATGGYQMFAGTPGTHFWAEFYVPAYGWIPVDTSAGQLAEHTPAFSAAQVDEFESYFFANQDPYRMVVQKDVDLPLMPEPNSPVFYEVVLQVPNLVVESGDPDMAIMAAVYGGYKMDAQIVDEND